MIGEESVEKDEEKEKGIRPYTNRNSIFQGESIIM